MRKTILCILIIFMIFSCRKSNTNPTPAPAPAGQDTLYAWIKYPKTDSGSLSDLEDIWFADPNNGIVATGGGLKSSGDGGITWTYIPNSHSGYNIQFLDNQHGFVQDQSLISVTTDGGKTWTAKSGGGGIYFQFVSPAVGFTYSIGLGIYSTHDGGNSWTSIFRPLVTEQQRYPFYFLDSLRGFSMMNGNCYKTVDGGLNWQMQSNVTTIGFGNFNKMQFLDTLNGYCGSLQGLLKTSDGGKTWNTSLSIPVPASNFVILQFFDVNNGYCMSSNSIYKTTNGGKDWTISCRLGKNFLLGLFFLDMNTGWACTGDGYVLRLKP